MISKLLLPRSFKIVFSAGLSCFAHLDVYLGTRHIPGCDSRVLSQFRFLQVSILFRSG